MPTAIATQPATSAIAAAVALGRFSGKWVLAPLLGLGPLGAVVTFAQVTFLLINNRTRVAKLRLLDKFEYVARSPGNPLIPTPRPPLDLKVLKIKRHCYSIMFSYKGRIYEVGVMEKHIVIADEPTRRMLDPDDLPQELKQLLRELAVSSLLKYP